MRCIWAVVICSGTSLWLSHYYQAPSWALWSLLSLGVLTWVLAKWLESRNIARESKIDQAH